MDGCTPTAEDVSRSPCRSTKSDQICSICRTIDFQRILHGKCGIEPALYKASGLEGSDYDDTRKFNGTLGTLQRISSTTSCPVCRLVSGCISSYGKPLAQNSVLHLRAVSRASGIIARTRDTNIVRGLIFDLRIQSCRCILQSGAHRPCRMIGLGSITPVNPQRSKQEIVFETPLDEAKSQRDLATRHCAYARSVAPHIDVKLVLDWIAYCVRNHTQCRENVIRAPGSHTNLRLIDVKNKHVVLHDTRVSYVALSYVWGSDTRGLLTRSTFDKYALAGSLSLDDVPATIRDAIGLVADLGERYLWVDSLCIIQDDLEDKRRYLPLMGEIYSAASMVLVAAVENAHSGLPGRGSLERKRSRPMENIHGIDFTVGWPESFDYLPTTTWGCRGWTYQEAELARRRLIVTEYQASWSCCEEYCCEDRFTEFLPNSDISSVHNSPLNTQTAPLRSRSSYLSGTSLCALGEYSERVREFSPRTFSDPKESVWTFRGILKSLLPYFPLGYIWAMPKAKLDATLLWRTNNTRRLEATLMILTKQGEWQEKEIPSWCWICKGTEAWYDDCYETVEPMVQWHQPVDVNKYGPLSGSSEEMKEKEAAGKMQSATIFQSSLSAIDQVFDYALLHFTADSTSLRLQIPLTEDGRSDSCFMCSFITATIHLPSGNGIGSIHVPIKAFCHEDRFNRVSTHDIEGEFILLSSVTGKGEDGTETPELRYNIMLLSWSDDKEIAYRVSWTSVARSAWEQCETQRKTIILG